MIPGHLYDHPVWPLLLSVMHINRSAAEAGHDDPRPRGEVVTRDPWVLATLQSVRIQCARCGQACAPIRARADNPYSLYLTVSCDPDDNEGCSHSGPASDEMRRVASMIETRTRPPGPWQPLLTF